MDEILSEMLEGNNKATGFGMAGTAVWIMGLHRTQRERYVDILAKLFNDMSMDELRAVKHYVQYGGFFGCKEMEALIREPVFPREVYAQIIDSSPWPRETRFEKWVRIIARWLGGAS